MTFKARLAFVAAIAVLLPGSALSAPSTSAGRISVAQVLELIEKSASDSAARQTLIAYLAGIGETAGLLFAEEAVVRAALVSCQRAMVLTPEHVRLAVSEATGSALSETPATPIILEDMFERAGCR